MNHATAAVHIPAQTAHALHAAPRAAGIASQGVSCPQLLEACAGRAHAVQGALAAQDRDRDLAATLAECTLLCRTTRDAIEMRARTERELRLICAAICHLVADLCSERPEDWASPLAALALLCAESCRNDASSAPHFG